MSLEVFAAVAAKIKKESIDDLCEAIDEHRRRRSAESLGFWNYQLRIKAVPWVLVAAHLLEVDMHLFRELSGCFDKFIPPCVADMGTDFDVATIVDHAASQVEDDPRSHQVCAYLDRMNQELLTAGFVI